MPFRLPWRAESALFDMLPRVKKCPFLATLPCPFLGLGETLRRRADKAEREERMHREKLELEKQKLVFEREEKQKQREMDERFEKESLEK